MPSSLAVLALCVLAVQAAAPAGLEQIQRIVIFMQENRAFDHYYGLLKGVRGFSDHAAPLLQTGRPPWYQPTDAGNVSGPYMLPFHVDMQRTSGSCMDAPEMNYPTDIGIWNDGRLDAWNTARVAGYGMSYFNRSDLPYYYTLADNFVVGDQYFQSTLTQTNPNRLHLFSGSNGLSAGYDAVLDNTEIPPGHLWETVAETLQKSNVSWKLYQEEDNFDDNGFAWFKTFELSKPGSVWYDNGMARVGDLETAFRADLAANTLPQVSWIVAPTNLSEHATNHPADGEDLTARLLKALQDYPDIYANTAFILNYDEGGQFFDHNAVPTPPADSEDGASTVTTKGEITKIGLPIGPGFRVPLMIMSPWTRGNGVCSQMMDHTSVVQLLETRFNVHCPNISPWRRAVMGNLATCFDFASPPDYSWPVFPDTSNNTHASAAECHNNPPPTIPANQSLPVVEPGTRTALPLPYVLDATLHRDPTTQRAVLTIVNNGSLGAAFVLHNLGQPTARVLKYTAGAHATLTAPLPAATAGAAVNVSLHGPNGFVRALTLAAAAPSGLAIEFLGSASATGQAAVLTVVVRNPHARAFRVTVSDGGVYGAVHGAAALHLAPHAALAHALVVEATGRWYDVVVSVFEADGESGAAAPSVLSVRAKGHVETGAKSSTDPALGLAPSPEEAVKAHPPLPETLLPHRHWTAFVPPADNKDAFF